MTLRVLKASDVFPMIQIINKIGIRNIKDIVTPEQIKEFQKNKDGDDTSILGFNIVMEFVGLILDNLPLIEQDLYKFLAGLAETSPEEIRDLDLGTFTNLIVDVIQKPEFGDFMKAVSRLVK